MRSVEMLAAICACLLACCASVGRRSNTVLTPALPGDYRLEIAEDRATHRFTLRLVSTTTRRLCIGEHQWPNNLGQLHFAADRVFVIVEDSKYYVNERNLGYPEGVVEIPPHKEVTGFISFSEFAAKMSEDPDIPRKLVFSVRPFYCDEPSVLRAEDARG